MIKNITNNIISLLAPKNNSPSIVTASNTVNKKKNLHEIPQSVYTTRKDIANWRNALNSAQDAENTDSTELISIYDSITNDSRLTSQINNRTTSSTGSAFVINVNGKLNEQLTETLSSKKWINDISILILKSIYYGHSLIDISVENGMPVINPVNPLNVEPSKGMFYPDNTKKQEGDGINYRKLPAYKTYILEFGTNYPDGLINKAVPHALFKKFAQSCWSELCEIYGIPPRVMKTNTHDKPMLTNAKRAMESMGAAAWFIIDKDEDFQFAQGVNTNGDVYNNFVKLCNDEMSMLITGAILGQDTANGSRSKDENSLKILDKLVDSDILLLEHYFESTVFPALSRMGIVPAGTTIVFDRAENLTMLWDIVNDGMKNGLEIDVEWLNKKFSTKFKGYLNTTPSPKKQSLKAIIQEDDFFS